MKKQLSFALAGAILLSMVGNDESLAAKRQSDIKYLSKSNAKKILAGKYVFDGVKLNGKMKTYVNSGKYDYDGNIDLKLHGLWDHAYAEGQENKDYEFQIVNKIIDDFIDKDYPRSKMLKYYGKPLRTIFTYENGNPTYYDVYEKVTFSYNKVYNDVNLDHTIFYNVSNKNIRKEWYDTLKN